jgi:hypothetical protein
MSTSQSMQISYLRLDYEESIRRLLTLGAELQEKLEDAITVEQLAALALDIYSAAQMASVLREQLALNESVEGKFHKVA